MFVLVGGTQCSRCFLFFHLFKSDYFAQFWGILLEFQLALDFFLIFPRIAYLARIGAFDFNQVLLCHSAMSVPQNIKSASVFHCERAVRAEMSYGTVL